MFKEISKVATGFSPCLSKKRQSLELGEREICMDSRCVCDRVFCLRIEEKAIAALGKKSRS